MRIVNAEDIEKSKKKEDLFHEVSDDSNGLFGERTKEER